MDDDFDYGDEVVSAASSAESQTELQVPGCHLTICWCQRTEIPA
jgi:hypothetical protein